MIASLNGHASVNGGQSRNRADRDAPIGLITGSGTYVLSLEDPERMIVATEFGTAEATRGQFCGVEIVHLSRHGNGHVRLSNQVTHRANIAALSLVGVRCAVGMTICGAVDPELGAGDMIVFDDLYFPSNRLPDGSLCTFHVTPGEPQRAHWIFEQPYAESLRHTLIDAATVVGPVQDGGCYGHVDGPRFNTVAEIRALRMCGISAVSQTAGPETVLAGEAGIPFALLGYVTDYANGAGPESTTVEELIANMVESVDAFGAVVQTALPRIADLPLDPVGERYGFETMREVYGAMRP